MPNKVFKVMYQESPTMNRHNRDFSGGTVVKTSRFKCRWSQVRSTVRELRSPCAAWHGQNKTKQNKCRNESEFWLWQLLLRSHFNYISVIPRYYFGLAKRKKKKKNTPSGYVYNSTFQDPKLNITVFNIRLHLNNFS